MRWIDSWHSSNGLFLTWMHPISNVYQKVSGRKSLSIQFWVSNGWWIGVMLMGMVKQKCYVSKSLIILLSLDFISKMTRLVWSWMDTLVKKLGFLMLLWCVIKQVLKSLHSSLVIMNRIFSQAHLSLSAVYGMQVWKKQWTHEIRENIKSKNSSFLCSTLRRAYRNNIYSGVNRILCLNWILFPRLDIWWKEPFQMPYSQKWYWTKRLPVQNWRAMEWEIHHYWL